MKRIRKIFGIAALMFFCVNLTVCAASAKKTAQASGKNLLYGKTIIGVGDSLLSAHTLGKKYSWLNLLGSKYKMKTYNCGRSALPVANTPERPTSMIKMCKEIKREVKNADIIILQGGANDQRVNVPLGDINSTKRNTFCGALNETITFFRKNYPHAKIFCMTNYARRKAANDLGLYDLDYVNAMLQVCKKRHIPCFDNYHDSDVDFFSDEWRAWGSESAYLGEGLNYHFSPAAYRKLLPIYEAFILKTLRKG